MADVTLQVTIPDAKVTIASERFLKIHPNEELNNIEDPNSGLKYTNKDWVEECILRWLIEVIHRGKIKLEREAAATAPDVTMATRT